MPDGHTVRYMSTPQAEAVAAEVRAALARRQITQTSLAQTTGRSQAYWSRRLNGRAALSMDDLSVIATVAGVSIADLVTEPTAAAS